MHMGEERKTTFIHFNSRLTQREFKAIKRQDMKSSKKIKANGDMLGGVEGSDSDGRNF